MKKFWSLLNSRAITVELILFVAIVIAYVLSKNVEFRLPGHNQGFSPKQPIAFSHRLHAGDMHIDCQYCHFNAERGIHAGIPAIQTCLNCHRFVDPNNSPELQKLYDAAGLGPDKQPDPGKHAKSLQWVQIHQLPAFVHFDHSRHVLAGVACQTCHGTIEGMDRVRQEKTLSMGMCINCHRQVNIEGVNNKPVHASIDCAVCHH